MRGQEERREEQSTLFSPLRLMPQNLQAEQALLGALLANNKAFEGVGEFLHPHHFADPVHGAIFAAISRLMDAGKVADPITLRAEFENSGTLQDVGGIAYLAELVGAMVGIINAANYGRTILDAWIRRTLIDACEVAVNKAFAPGEMSGQEILEELDVALLAITDGAGDVRPAMPAGEAVHQALTMAAANGEREETLAGLTTGIDGLDQKIGGMIDGQLYLLGARPAMGKTGLALTIAARVAWAGRIEEDGRVVRAGNHVLFWSGEMAAAQMGARLAASHARMEVMSIFRGKNWQFPYEEVEANKGKLLPLTEGDWDRLMRAQTDAHRLTIAFDDRPGITVSALRARARRMKRAKKLDMVIVDYIGLMRASAQTEKQKLYERLTEISRDLKMMAAELAVPVLALTQLNRDVEKREVKVPQLSDLRDSGALEQDAYCVIFLHRHHYYLVQAGEPVQGAKETHEVFNERYNIWVAQVRQTRDSGLLSVAKNRNGATGTARVKFDARTIWFRDEAESADDTAWGASFDRGG
jgi:replicative DNA helicase